MRVRPRQVLLHLLLVFVAGGTAFAGPATMTVQDLAGRRVDLPGVPRRILCLAPGTLRLIVYLGAQERLVGVEDFEKRFPTSRPYWLAHPELSRLPSAGAGGVGAINRIPDLETILALEPEVIFITYLGARKADLLQQRSGVPVIVLSYGSDLSFDESAYRSLRLAGRVLGLERRAAAVLSFIEGQQADLAARGGTRGRRPAAYVGCIGYRGTHGIESSEAAYTPFAWLGIDNLAGRRNHGGHLFVDREDILTWDPPVLFVDAGGSHLLEQDYRKNRSYYRALQAFRRKSVHLLHPYNWYLTNIGTMICDAYAVGKIVFPDRFRDIDPAAKCDSIYRFLLGRPLYEQMARLYGPLGGVPAFLH
ncbi:MAG: iron ABC transporter substrate-binding protein [Deltaproteobacteria bacterium]|nr:MAG: iron ABC transporter substrate-binding protein [Deltaproteobacteria bacterium]